MRDHKWVAIFIAALPIFLVLSAYGQDNYYTGLGCSNPETVGKIEIGKSEIFEVAMLVNTGTLDLHITTITVVNATGLHIIVFGKHTMSDNNTISNPFLLHGKPTPQADEGDRLWVYANVSLSENKTYSVEFRFKCDVQMPANIAGNPSVPGATATAIFVATSSTVPPAFNWTLAIIGFVAIGALGVGVTVYLKKRRDTTIVSVKAKKTKKSDKTK